MNIRSLAVALACAAPLLGGSAQAGPPNDPRTPINAVNTPGDADSIYRITASGSYYLEAALTGVASKYGIEIAASDVHVDLMGFSLQGVHDARAAVVALETQHSITVRNGSLSMWANGVDLQLVDNAQVREISVYRGSGGAILVKDGGVVSGCSIREPGGRGIWAEAGALVSDCVVIGGSTNAMAVGEGSTVRNCVVRLCNGVGITALGQTSVLACTISYTTTAIFGTGRVLVADCNLSNNSVGVRLQSGTVRGCTVTANTIHGIDSTMSVHIVGNFVLGNLGDGIRVESSGRIEDNDVRGNGGTGVRVFGAGAFVVKNTLVGNGSPLIVPNSGSFVGTLVHVNGINGRTDPWANIFAN